MSNTPISHVFGADERERIHAAEELLDDGSKRLIERLGIGKGANCLEIGAGGGSIAAWMCEIVGSRGTAVATDLDVRALELIGAENLEVRRPTS